MTETRPNTTRIAFIGFGEVGQRFARDFGARDSVMLSAFDVALADATRRDRYRAAAEHLHVGLAADAQAACARADIVFAAVTADQTEAVARAAGA